MKYHDRIATRVDRRHTARHPAARASGWPKTDAGQISRDAQRTPERVRDVESLGLFRNSAFGISRTVV